MMTFLLLAAACAVGAFGILQESLIVCLLAGTLFCLLAAISFGGFVQRAMVIAASVLFSWTAMEAALAFMEPSADADVAFLDPASDDPVAYWQISDAYGVLPSPGTHRAKKTTKDGGVIYDVVYSTDADGFRETAGADGARGGEVVFLGGSTTFGEGLNDDQTLPHHFSRREPGLTVRNLAVSGWGLHQAFSLWRNAVTQADTTVIVQTAPWHADRVACVPKFSGLSPRYDHVDGEMVQTGRCRTWFENRYLARLMMKSGLLQRLYDAVNLERHGRKMDLYLAMLQAMQDLAEDRGQCLIVSFLKAEDVYLDGTGHSNETIKTALADAGLIVVDTTLADSREALPAHYAIPGDGHPTDAANRERADILSSAIAKCDRQRFAARAGTARKDIR